jgi:hypothetical protein
MPLQKPVEADIRCLGRAASDAEQFLRGFNISLGLTAIATVRTADSSTFNASESATVPGHDRFRLDEPPEAPSKKCSLNHLKMHGRLSKPA